MDRLQSEPHVYALSHPFPLNATGTFDLPLTDRTWQKSWNVIPVIWFYATLHKTSILVDRREVNFVGLMKLGWEQPGWEHSHGKKLWTSSRT